MRSNRISLLFLFGAGLLCSAQAQQKTIHDYIAQAPFSMPDIPVPSFPAKDFLITDYGASGNGKTLNTDAFEKAITACSAAGGGRVVVPKGVWLTGPVKMQSNVNLHLEKDALVQFTSDHTQYPIIHAGNSSGSFTPASPVYGYDLSNIAITGEGVFDGAGESWRPVKKSKMTPDQWRDITRKGIVSRDGSVWWPTSDAMDGEDYLKKLRTKTAKPEAADYLPARDYLRPYMVYFVNCTNVLLKGVTIRNSPKFVFYPNHCTNLVMDHVNIFNDWWAQNGDGIDISACRNVAIYACTVNAGDDGICMKSSGSKNDAPGAFDLENILVAGCIVFRAHGGFVIGSNTDGGMHNIYVTDCNYIGTDVGIRVKSNAGRGGLVRDIYIDNIHMQNIVTDAISFDTYYEDVPAGKTIDSVRTTVRDKTPVFTDFHISHISCIGAARAITMTGLPEMPVKRIFFDDMDITANKGFTGTDVEDIFLKNVRMHAPEPLFHNTRAKNVQVL